MEAVKRYKNIVSSTISGLDVEVSKAMEEGWFPTGNIAELIGGKVYAQSMILYPSYHAPKHETWACLPLAQRVDDVTIVGGDNGND